MHTAELTSVDCELYLQNQCPVMPDFFSGLQGIRYSTAYHPEQSDIAFLAGIDWRRYLPQKPEGQPVINLIQHVRHGDQQHELFQYLQHEALRICVSDAVRKAIEPYANGKCITIKMGHVIPQMIRPKDIDLYILGKKNPNMAIRIAEWANKANLSVCCDHGLVERNTVFANMARAKVSLVLPNPTEGFFLPGIEAMALSDRVVVPDCVANREYCLSLTNTTVCDYTEKACINAVKFASQRRQHPLQRIEKLRGKYIARQYSLAKEKRQYQKLIKSHFQM